MVDHFSWATGDCPRDLAALTSSSEGLGSVSESPRGRPAVSRDSRLSPRARGVDQLSQVTPAQVLGLMIDQLSRAPRGRARCTAGFTSCLGGLGPGSECPGCRPSVPRFGPGSQVPWGQPGVPGNSHSSPRARGVDPLSRVSRARVRWSGGSTSFPRPLGHVSEVPRVRPALPGESRSALRANGVDLRSWETRARALWPAGSTRCSW